jgi:hypothetical protein
VKYSEVECTNKCQSAEWRVGYTFCKSYLACPILYLKRSYRKTKWKSETSYFFKCHIYISAVANLTEKNSLFFIGRWDVIKQSFLLLVVKSSNASNACNRFISFYKLFIISMQIYHIFWYTEQRSKKVIYLYPFSSCITRRWNVLINANLQNGE